MPLGLGMYPGPTIEANQGDRIVVNVTNKLENSTYVSYLCFFVVSNTDANILARRTIHWHGLVRPLLRL
jgi:FtsP/CotA-like multicopper oxidase with cupredoxin domain